MSDWVYLWVILGCIMGLATKAVLDTSKSKGSLLLVLYLLVAIGLYGYLTNPGASLGPEAREICKGTILALVLGVNTAVLAHSFQGLFPSPEYKAQQRQIKLLEEALEDMRYQLDCALNPDRPASITITLFTPEEVAAKLPPGWDELINKVKALPK